MPTCISWKCYYNSMCDIHRRGLWQHKEVSLTILEQQTMSNRWTSVRKFLTNVRCRVPTTHACAPPNTHLRWIALLESLKQQSQGHGIAKPYTMRILCCSYMCYDTEQFIPYQQTTSDILLSYTELIRHGFTRFYHNLLYPVTLYHGSTNSPHSTRR